MASRDDKTATDDDTITRGTGNVFADLGYPDANERQTKLRLAHMLNAVIARHRLTQAAAAGKLGINQPKISALAHYRLGGFSVERLMSFLTSLDQDIDIVIRGKSRSHSAGRISVIAAPERTPARPRPTGPAAPARRSGRPSASRSSGADR
jgi:predicted XRE-type DNA-binding protein